MPPSTPIPNPMIAALAIVLSARALPRPLGPDGAARHLERAVEDDDADRDEQDPAREHPRDQAAGDPSRERGRGEPAQQTPVDPPRPRVLDRGGERSDPADHHVRPGADGGGGGEADGRPGAAGCQHETAEAADERDGERPVGERDRLEGLHPRFSSYPRHRLILVGCRGSSARRTGRTPDGPRSRRATRRWPCGCARATSTSSSARTTWSPPGSALRAAIEAGAAALGDLLRPAGRGQDDAGADRGQPGRAALRGGVGGQRRPGRGAGHDRARRPSAAAPRTRRRSSSSTRSTASTRPSRTPCCRPSRRG